MAFPCKKQSTGGGVADFELDPDTTCEEFAALLSGRSEYTAECLNDKIVLFKKTESFQLEEEGGRCKGTMSVEIETIHTGQSCYDGLPDDPKAEYEKLEPNAGPC